MNLPPLEGVGNAGCPWHPRPRVHLVVVERTRVTTSTPESPDVPARNGFNGFLRALPGDRALLPPSPTDMFLSKPGWADSNTANLTPASGVRTTRLRRTHDARESASLTRVKHLQFGNAIVGAAEPPTKLTVDILHHHHIRMDVGLVAGVEFSGRKLVQHGWALRDDGGGSVLHFDKRHFAEKITRLETCHAN